jgi:hypothetical protein
MFLLAGRPRLNENKWRLDALKEINSHITHDADVQDISTFSYLNTIEELSKILFVDPFLLQDYNVHIAILGSKLQTIGSWVISSLVRSITVVTSIPSTYFPESFSEGKGESWVIKLELPK